MAEKIGAGGKLQEFDKETGEYGNGEKIFRQNTEYSELVGEKDNLQKNKNPQLSKEEFYGKEITLNEGENPIEVMLLHKEGHIKNAFHRKEMKNIDLVWGTTGKNGAGLAHLIERRDEMYRSGKGTITGLDMAHKIPEILEKGVLVEDSQNRFNFEFEKYRVGVKPSYDGEKVNWIVSAMEILK